MNTETTSEETVQQETAADTTALKKEESKLSLGQRAKALGQMLMGKTPADAAAAVDETVVALRTENEALKKENTDLKAEIKEAEGYMQELANWQKGQPAPEAPAAAGKAVEAIQNATAAAIQKVGISTEALSQPQKEEPAAATDPKAKEARRLAAVDAAWASAGYDRSALTQN